MLGLLVSIRTCKIVPLLMRDELAVSGNEGYVIVGEAVFSLSY